jgi:hypothetical protein
MTHSLLCRHFSSHFFHFSIEMNIIGTLPLVYIMIDRLSALHMRERLGLAFKFAVKFPVGGSVLNVFFIS